jgi:hypothetical protein
VYASTGERKARVRGEKSDRFDEEIAYNNQSQNVEKKKKLIKKTSVLSEENIEV